MECLRSVAESAQSLKLRGSDLVGVKTRSGEKKISYCLYDGSILLSWTLVKTVWEKYLTHLELSADTDKHFNNTVQYVCVYVGN